MAVRFFQNQACGLSKARLYVMRVLYFLTAIIFGVETWTTLVTPSDKFGALESVAYCFWAALSTVMIIGIRFPVKMLPVLLLQFLYKAVWLIFVGYPLSADCAADEHLDRLMIAIQLDVVLDLLAIPWPFAVRTYMIAIFRSGEP